MIRVLHTAGPEDASRRTEFLGVSLGDRARLLQGLHHYILCVPDGGIARSLAELLQRKRTPHAWGKEKLFFSVSSAEQVEKWQIDEPGSGKYLYHVLEAIRRYLARDFLVPCRERTLVLNGSPRIMGILNVTPDSFSDGGKYHATEAAVRRGIEMAEEGAEIIDVGGESTRPGSHPVTEREQIARVVPVIRELAGKTGALLSVDTTKSGVALRATEAGASIINDTSALSDDPMMTEAVRESGCAVVLMHRKGKPATMQQSPGFDSLFDEILDDLSERIDEAQGAGIPPERILVDPGVGFGKRIEDNLALHRHLPDLRNLGRPILFGPSRKSFLGKITGKEVCERIFGTAAAVAVSVIQGVDILRVHDVKEMREVASVVDAIRKGAEC